MSEMHIAVEVEVEVDVNGDAGDAEAELVEATAISTVAAATVLSIVHESMNLIWLIFRCLICGVAKKKRGMGYGVTPHITHKVVR